jgi:ER lumen protein retaining receptor
MIFHYRDSHYSFLEVVREIFWAFSIYLEAIAILPQLFMLQRTGEAETITTHYLFALGAYRALYIPNWIYRYVQDRAFPEIDPLIVVDASFHLCRYFSANEVDPISILAGLVQTGLYLDFFYSMFARCLHITHSSWSAYFCPYSAFLLL